jgi:hypothetical protein|tara:strand:+ start:792 stop:1094 length:303 start_codon:yes stop_codon:yes gene_type:complete
MTMNEKKKIEIEAATFRRLVEHFREHTEVQNIDLMNLAEFCRNCISKWYKKAAEDNDIELEYEEARKIIYGMPYSDWKDKYQKEMTQEQKEKFEARKKRN